MANLGSHRLGTTSSCSTYTMSRLLFAAARGARIEESWQDKWELADRNTVWDVDFYRVHPDDERLQYGPISTALREGAEDKPAYGEFPKGMSYGLSYYEFVWTYYNHGCNDELQRSLFLLILAEALADEGL